MHDSQIVDFYLRREEAAISYTSEKYGSRLYSLAYGIVNDSQTAEECENDTYYEAWNAIPPHEPRTYLYPFLARIARHISLNICRDRKRLKRSMHIVELSEEMEQCIPAPNDTECMIGEMELKKAINQFLSSISEEKRNIFLRRYWFLDSIETISKRYGISESKVKTTLFRCRSQFRHFLSEEGYNL